MPETQEAANKNWLEGGMGCFLYVFIFILQAGELRLWETRSVAQVQSCLAADQPGFQEMENLVKASMGPSLLVSIYLIFFFLSPTFDLSMYSL